MRLVRVTKQPIATGESYRLLVDELPAETAAGEGRSVKLVMRYSVPLFIYTGHATAAKLAWSLEQRGGQSYLSVTNDGDRHARLSALKLRDGSATRLASFGDGLAGYVLGHLDDAMAGAGQLVTIGARPAAGGDGAGRLWFDRCRAIRAVAALNLSFRSR